MRIRGSAVVSPREAATFTSLLLIAEQLQQLSRHQPAWCCVDEESVTVSIDYGLRLYGNPCRTLFVSVTPIVSKGQLLRS
jgi:hypothetical protein